MVSQVGYVRKVCALQTKYGNFGTAGLRENTVGLCENVVEFLPTLYGAICRHFTPNDTIYQPEEIVQKSTDTQHRKLDSGIYGRSGRRFGTGKKEFRQAALQLPTPKCITSLHTSSYTCGVDMSASSKPNKCRQVTHPADKLCHGNRIFVASRHPQLPQSKEELENKHFHILPLLIV